MESLSPQPGHVAVTYSINLSDPSEERDGVLLTGKIEFPNHRDVIARKCAVRQQLGQVLLYGMLDMTEPLARLINDHIDEGGCHSTGNAGLTMQVNIQKGA